MDLATLERQLSGITLAPPDMHRELGDLVENREYGLRLWLGNAARLGE